MVDNVFELFLVTKLCRDYYGISFLLKTGFNLILKYKVFIRICVYLNLQN